LTSYGVLVEWEQEFKAKTLCFAWRVLQHFCYHLPFLSKLRLFILFYLFLINRITKIYELIYQQYQQYQKQNNFVFPHELKLELQHMSINNFDLEESRNMA
jgi:hypothetical protein